MLNKCANRKCIFLGKLCKKKNGLKECTFTTMKCGCISLVHVL